MVTATYGGDAAHSASHRSTLTAVTTSPLPKVRIGSGKLMLRGGAVATRPGCPSGETFCDGTESIYTTQAFAASANKPRARPLLLGQARFHIPGGATQTVKIRVGKRAL